MPPTPNCTGHQLAALENTGACPPAVWPRLGPALSWGSAWTDEPPLGYERPPSVRVGARMAPRDLELNLGAISWADKPRGVCGGQGR